MTEYQILEAPSTEELASMVCGYLRDGWKVAGGLATLHPPPRDSMSGMFQPDPVFLQAISRDGAAILSAPEDTGL